MNDGTKRAASLAAIREQKQKLEGMMDRIRRHTDDLLQPLLGRVDFIQARMGVEAVTKRLDELFAGIVDNLAEVKSSVLQNIPGDTSRPSTNLFQAKEAIENKSKRLSGT